VFVPDNGKVDALKIVKEQLRQVGESYAANHYANATLPVYYNSIGATFDMNATCDKRLNCVHMQHYSQAFEEVTLHRVYEYCQAHPQNKIIYMHSKGKFLVSFIAFLRASIDRSTLSFVALLRYLQ
jgi:hypothetical protein